MLHWFPRDILGMVPDAVWDDNEEPTYDSNDPEIVTHSVRSS